MTRISGNRGAIMRHQLEEAIKHWDHVAPIVQYPRNGKEFNKLVAQLDELLNMVGDNEKHRLMGLVDVISNIVSSYEAEHFSAPPVKGIDALKFLMDSNHLHQSDLPEIGSQGIVSEILNGKRNLNLRQIKLLADRFQVDPSTFIE